MHATIDIIYMNAEEYLHVYMVIHGPVCERLQKQVERKCTCPASKITSQP